MFPIPFNFPFIKKNGERTTIGDAINAGGGGGGYTLPTASAETKGGVKIGSGLTMTGEVLSNTNPTPYSLPTASDSELGGIKVGSGLSIDDGVLSASGGSGGGLTVLWENAEPAGASSLNITLSSSDYTYLVFECIKNVYSGADTILSAVPKSKPSQISFTRVTYSSNTPELECISRDVTFTDATHLTVANANKIYINPTAVTGNQQNTILVPLKVYGVK